MDGRQNFSFTTTDSSINTTDTTVTLSDATNMPPTPFNAIIYTGSTSRSAFQANALEFVRVTDITTGVATIVRDRENGTNQSFASGAKFEATPTADTFDQLKSYIDGITQSSIDSSAEKTALVNADRVPLLDSEDSDTLKHFQIGSLPLGATELIASTELTSTASQIDFTDLDFTNYSAIAFFVQPKDATPDVTVQFSDDNGSTFYSTGYKYNSASAFNSAWVFGYSGSDSSIVFNTGDNAQGIWLTMIDTGTYTSIGGYCASGGNAFATLLAGARTGGGVDAIRFAFSSGSFPIGTKIGVYGLKI